MATIAVCSLSRTLWLGTQSSWMLHVSFISLQVPPPLTTAEAALPPLVPPVPFAAAAAALAAAVSVAAFVYVRLAGRTRCLACPLLHPLQALLVYNLFKPRIVLVYVAVRGMTASYFVVSQQYVH